MVDEKMGGVSVRSARTHFDALMEKITDTGKSIAITKHGEPVAYLISPELFHRLGRDSRSVRMEGIARTLGVTNRLNARGPSSSTLDGRTNSDA